MHATRAGREGYPLSTRYDLKAATRFCDGCQPQCWISNDAGCICRRVGKARADYFESANLREKLSENILLSNGKRSGNHIESKLLILIFFSKYIQIFILQNNSIKYCYRVVRNMHVASQSCVSESGKGKKASLSITLIQKRTYNECFQ